MELLLEHVEKIDIEDMKDLPFVSQRGVAFESEKARWHDHFQIKAQSASWGFKCAMNLDASIREDLEALGLELGVEQLARRIECSNGMSTMIDSLFEFIKNSIDAKDHFHKVKGMECTLECTLQIFFNRDDHKLLLLYRDNGPGFSSEQKERHHKRERAHSLGGNGLGMKAARDRIGEENFITYTHEEGGACIEIHSPLADLSQLENEDFYAKHPDQTLTPGMEGLQAHYERGAQNFVLPTFERIKGRLVPLSRLARAQSESSLTAGPSRARTMSESTIPRLRHADSEGSFARARAQTQESGPSSSASRSPSPSGT